MSPDPLDPDGLAWQSMELAVALVNTGNLDRAVEWFGTAATLNLPGAAAVRDAVEALRAARLDAAIISLNPNTPHRALRDASTRVEEATRAFESALTEAAYAAAQRLTEAAEERAHKIIADAHRRADVVRGAGESPPA